MAKRAAALAGPRSALSKKRVLETAIRLADEGGIESLSMRKLAQELGVEAMSLYHYVAGKDEILSGIAEMVLSEIEPPSRGADWKAAVRKSAVSFHDALSRHRWAHGLIASPRKVPPAQLRYMEALLRRLREAGFSPNLTHHAYHALDSHIIGSALWEAGISAAMPKGSLPTIAQSFLSKLPIEEYPYFHEHVQQHLAKATRADKSPFEFGLDLILDGLERIRDGAVRRPRGGGRAASVRPRMTNSS